MVEDPPYHLLAEQETRKLILVLEFYPALSLLRYPILPGAFYPFYVLHLNRGLKEPV